jgi:hypothetical protein
MAEASEDLAGDAWKVEAGGCSERASVRDAGRVE